MTKFTFLSQYDNSGKPHNMEPSKFISSDLLNETYQNLPNNNKTVLDIHPDWIRKSDIYTTEDCEIEITFISEGAGYKNGFGYYVYDINNHPNTFSDIENIFIVFPNASLQNKGGSLTPGDTMKMVYESLSDIIINNITYVETGNFTFPKNKGIGFVCLANQWKNNNSVNAFLNVNHRMYSSDPSLNPENKKHLKNHSVNYLSSVDSNKIIYGFEDLRRDKYSDNDFNDFIYCISPNPIDAIKNTSYNSVKTQKFSGYILCEDINRTRADFDYNDLTMQYNITEEIVSDRLYSITIKLQCLNRGATYNHNFGVIIPNIKTKVNCKIIRETYITETDEVTKKCLTHEVIGITDKIILIKDTKRFLKSHNDEIYTNTKLSNTQKLPSYSYVKILFIDNDGSKGISKKELNNLSFSYRFFLDVYKSDYLYNINNIDHSIYSDQLYEVSEYMNEMGIESCEKILLLQNDTGFRCPAEKIPFRKAYPKFIDYLKSNKVNFNNWNSKLLYKEHFLNTEIIHNDLHIYEKSLELDFYDESSKILFKSLDFSVQSIEFNENQINDIFGTDKLTSSNLVDWNDLDSLIKIDSIANFIKEFGTCYMTLNNEYKPNILADNVYFISLTSTQNDNSRIVHDSKQGTSETLELLSTNVIQHYTPVFI